MIEKRVPVAVAAQMIGCDADHVRNLIDDGTLDVIDVSREGSSRPYYSVSMKAIERHLAGLPPPPVRAIEAVAERTPEPGPRHLTRGEAQAIKESVRIVRPAPAGSWEFRWRLRSARYRKFAGSFDERRKIEESKSKVYFMGCREFGVLKVGFTTQTPESRMAEIEQGVPFAMVLLEAVPGSLREEFELHRELGERRLRGEWYRLDDPEVGRMVRGWLDMRRRVFAQSPFPGEVEWALEGYRGAEIPRWVP